MVRNHICFHRTLNDLEFRQPTESHRLLHPQFYIFSLIFICPAIPKRENTVSPENDRSLELHPNQSSLPLRQNHRHSSRQTNQTSNQRCQCTICRRYAAAWAYYDFQDVKFENEGDAKTLVYLWSDRMIEFHFCENRGCVVYWYPAEIPEREEKDIRVNARMMEPGAMHEVDWEVSCRALKM